MTLLPDSVLVVIGVVVTGVKSEKIQNIILYCWCSVITEAGGALIYLQNTFAKSLQMVEAKNTFELMHITLHVKYIITSVKIFYPFPLKVNKTYRRWAAQVIPAENFSLKFSYIISKTKHIIPSQIHVQTALKKQDILGLKLNSILNRSHPHAQNKRQHLPTSTDMREMICV